MTRVSVKAQISIRRYQSLLERARREASKLTTAPARPRPTSAMRYSKPVRPTAEAPDWPWSWSMTLIRGSGHPNSWTRRASSQFLAQTTYLYTSVKQSPKALLERESERVKGVELDTDHPAAAPANNPWHRPYFLPQAH